MVRFGNPYRANVTIVIQWYCHTGNNPKWYANFVSDKYNLYPNLSQKTLDAPGGKAQSNLALGVWEANNGTNQQWNLIPMEQFEP